MAIKSEKYHVLGIMSGSSLDGVDLAFCEFKPEGNKWQFEIIQAETAPYDEHLTKILTHVADYSGEQLVSAHIEYGKFLGKLAHDFIRVNKLEPDFISSHGHTVFHHPKKGYSFQLGEGQALACSSGIQVVCDYRLKDILLGGQGAPLVPAGDQLLFSEFDICLNLGGIANLSYMKNKRRLAFDICPANQVLNNLARQIKLEYDDRGQIAAGGIQNDSLLAVLNADAYYRQIQPKSLSNQYVKSHFIDQVNQFEESIANKLRTFTEHIILRIDESTEEIPAGRMLVTGGGAKNSFLIERLKEISQHDIHVPEEKIIDFKEAMVFAFLGVLRKRNEMNCLSSVTGASADSSSGTIFYP